MLRKNYLLILSLFLPILAFGQSLAPHSAQVSYFGETVTHPGLRLSATYLLKEKMVRKRVTNRKIGSESSKGTVHALEVRPSLGFFFHRRHQTGLFLLPEIGYLRTNRKRRQFGTGLGIGYLHSIIPNVFEVTDEGQVEESRASHNFFLASIYTRWGRQLKDSQFGYFFQPQFLYALPNYPNGVAYLALEIGITYRLKSPAK